MTLHTVPGLWNSEEGIATRAGMEHACHAKQEFAHRLGVTSAPTPLAPSTPKL